MSTTPPPTRRATRNDRPEADAASTPSPDLDDVAAKAAKRAKAEKIGRTVAVFVMPLIIVGMMITGYLATMHSPTANHMPVAVAGPDAATTADALADAEPDALEVTTADSAYDAKQQVVDRDVVAAVVLEGDTAVLYTASAAGLTQATLVSGLVTPALLDDGYSVSAEDLVPLPDYDPSGLAAVFLATALVMAGYLPFSVLRSNSPELLKFRRIVPLIAGWAALIAALVWVVTGPIMGVVSSEHYLAVAAVAWLGVFAISCVQLFITRLIGPLGVIVGMGLLMVLGMPASNMSMSVYTMPSFYRFLHEILPMPAIGEAMRSVLYFDGIGVTRHLLVLAIGAVAGLLATALYDKLRGHKYPEGVAMDVNIPSLHGGPRPKNDMWRYVSLVFFPLAMVTMMLSCLLGAMHQPTPRDMPVAVVGATAEQAEQTAAALEENLDDMFVFSTYGAEDIDEVEALVEDRALVAALVLPSQQNPAFTLVGNQAGSPSAYQVATRVFTQVATAQQIPFEVDDLHPLPDSDSQGIVTMYVAMGWVLAGFMVVIVGANAAPATRPLKTMLPLTAVYAAFMSTVIWLIADPITGSVDGHFGALWGAGAVTIFCVAMFAMVFERLLGMLAVIPAVGILMFLGVPSANGPFSIYMAPDWFRTLHDFLPMPAAVETVRSILYFDGDTVWDHLQVLGLWGLVSLALVILIDAIKPVRTEHDFGDLHTTPDADVSAAAEVAADPEDASASADGAARDERELVGAGR
ncbi:ABC transporter permease [Microbacterium sp. GXF7504]